MFPAAMNMFHSLVWLCFVLLSQGLVADCADAYLLVQEQISSQVEFRPISLYDERSDGSLLVKANFLDSEHATKAMIDGVQVNGVVYKASSAKETREFGELKHVQFTLLRIANQETFLFKLMESLSYYGKVLQVKNWLSGQGKTQEAKPLDRMIYLSELIAWCLQLIEVLLLFAISAVKVATV
ncbi:hypothetical protein [Parasitella parasitica]|uniref:RRM domain-containing protein n=1 Tax=Parasitella parasitica TaxID=35722 RepID=A0A0B7NE37_9FUNG|nr:hypothetical protein [Parasitella parasitica]